MEVKFIIDKRRTEWEEACEVAKNRLLNTDATEEVERWTHTRLNATHHSGLPGGSVHPSVCPSAQPSPAHPHANTEVVHLIRKTPFLLPVQVSLGGGEVVRH